MEEFDKILREEGYTYIPRTFDMPGFFYKDFRVFSVSVGPTREGGIYYIAVNDLDKNIGVKECFVIDYILNLKADIRFWLYCKIEELRGKMYTHIANERNKGGIRWSK